MNIDEAVNKACQQPTLLDALSWIVEWEGDRAVHQALNNYGSGSDGAGWDTCFRYCLKQVIYNYKTDEDFA